jgi:hypothetical protein
MRIRSIVVVFAALILSSCGGVSGENGSDPFGSGSTTESFTITLAILDQQCNAISEPSFTAGETLCIQATLKQGDNLVAGEIVSFTAGLGSLSVESKLTDNNGVAQISINSGSGDVGAAALVVSVGDLTSQSNYEFLAADIAVLPAFAIDFTILKNGVAVNRFKANEQVQIQAVIRDENAEPVENLIVNFTTGRGSLNTNDALTDDSGTAQVTLTADDIDIGAAVVTALTLVNGEELLASLNFEIQSPDTISEQTIRIGHFNTDAVLAIVDENDQRILTQTPVSFTSICTEDGFATIDQQVNTVNGEAIATYEDISCAGGDGNEDVIVASVVVNNSTLSITRSITILAESVGSINFISADPTQLVLLGTGGQNSQTISTLLFQVNGTLGNPLAQQNVTFSLNTQTGGLSLFPALGITNSQGQVSARVTSGNVPTSVRVTAEVVTESGISVLTQSDLLAVNTGLPDQNSFTLSADNLNPEANSISGQTVGLVARLADTFNNPVPDGTSVSFTTEGGVIEPSCTTTNGTCGVTWTSANPRTSDHRITILATAIGHETLFDANGNNSYEDSDGGPISDNTDSGFGFSVYGETGFVDHSEAWRDDNEDNIRDAAEIFLDYNDDGDFNGPDKFFNGPQCIPGNACGGRDADSLGSLHVRKALVLVMSGSRALMDIINTSRTVIFSNYQTASQPDLSIDSGSSLSFTLRFSDSAEQPIASGSQILITSSTGTLAGQVEFVMPRTNRPGAGEISFTLSNDEADPVDSTVSALITSPSGIQSTVLFQVTLN